jgi:hypothetical protein
MNDAIGTALGLVQPVMSVVETLLGAVATFQETEDVVSTAITLALNALRGTLDDFISNSAGHLLFVPPIPPFRREPATPQIPVRQLADMVYGLGVVRGALESLIGDGGNSGLYRRFVDSLFDPGDYARPQYRSDAYVGGAILVFGSDSYAETLAGLLALSDVFGDSLNISMDGYSLPVPQNVKARPIAVPSQAALSDLSIVSAAAVGGTRDPYGAAVLPILSEPQLPPEFGMKVTWDPPKVVTFNVDFGPYVYRIKSWHVYLKPNSKLVPGDVLADYEVHSRELPGSGTATRALGITANADIVGNVSGCILQDLDPAITYYVGVAYTLEVEDLDSGDGPTTLSPSHETLSGQARVNLSEQAPYRKIQDGLPPDWMAIASPLAVFPKVQQTLAEARAIADLVIANYAAYENELSGLASLAGDALQTILDANDTLTDLISETRQIFTGLDIGIWGASFSGQGGVPYLISAVGELLLDPATGNRPPFHDGDEAISAMVFVTGSESAASVAAFVAVLNTIFGLQTTTTPNVIEDITRLEGPDGPIYLDEGANSTSQSLAQNLEPAEPPAIADLGIDDDDC